jgi:hypothetical protein
MVWELKKIVALGLVSGALGLPGLVFADAPQLMDELVLKGEPVPSELAVGDQPADGPAVGEPGLIKRSGEVVTNAVDTTRRVTGNAARGAVEHTGKWVEKGKQGTVTAWSKTRDAASTAASKTRQGAAAGVDTVRDSSGRVIDKSTEVGAGVWQTTKEYSAAAWDKSVAIARSVKEELVGSSDAPAEVIDKSVPAHSSEQTSAQP